ncbi:MAG: hypothetical protein S4CHLAM20_07840 [Chlamydiia bacterium]|nr:hypothetical protein [Chlamydiia bacterium]
MGIPYKKITLLSLVVSTHIFSHEVSRLHPEEKKRIKALDLVEINRHTNNFKSNKNIHPMMKSQILYLMSKGDQVGALRKYRQYFKKTGQHNYKLLREMSLAIIEQAVSWGEEEDTLLSLIAMEIAQEDSFTHHLGKLIHSKYYPVQAKTLSLLRRIDNEYSEMLIKSCLSSQFIMLRLEALSILVQKHNESALGQVEALMNMVHHFYHPMFVDFYALAGTKYAISVMKQMISNKNLNLNLATILAARNYRIEEMIPNLRHSLTHTSPIIQEAAAVALGSFSDSYSLSRLKTLSTSSHEETKLAALLALYSMDQKDYKDEIINLAKNGNLFAISSLASLDNTRRALHEIYYSDDNNLRINSALSMLEKKNPLSIPVIKDLITLDSNVFYIEVVNSPGKCFRALRLKPLSSLEKKEMIPMVKSHTVMIQNQILSKTIDLPRDKFMKIIDDIFLKKRNTLIPTAIALLENFDDDESKAYLSKKATMPGAPFIRTACHLSLWKSTKKKQHKEAITSWIKQFGKHEMISIQQKSTDKDSKKNQISEYELSLEEKSHLLIQAFLNISYSREKAGLDCILEAMINGHEKNRIPLAGVLLKTIQ